jgi:CO/xanthine dehydrogenase Mo-binding subunit
MMIAPARKYPRCVTVSPQSRWAPTGLACPIARGQDPSGAGRYRRDRDRPRHLRLAQHDDRRQRIARRGRRGHRARQTLCRPFHGGGCRRHRLCRRRVHDRRHRPVDADRPGRADVVYPCRPALGARRRPAGCGRLLLGVPSFPNGCHICEVEIDPRPARRRLTDTPSSTIATPSSTRSWRRGRSKAASPRAAGQALLQDVIYDRSSGLLLTGSLMDYGIPARAAPSPAHRR